MRRILEIVKKKYYSREYWEYCEKAFDKIKESELERIEVFHRKYLDVSKIFTISIDEIINKLELLKKEGYTSISQGWSGYEDNYFTADKIEKENDEEYAIRINSLIREEVSKLWVEQEEQEKKKQRIRELENELKQLKGGK